MISFQNKKTFRFDKERFTDKTISTLLVPAHLVEGLKSKTKENGNSLVIYLRNLLWMYRTLTHSGMIHPPRKIKTEYQDEGLDLKRVNFRVGNASPLVHSHNQRLRMVGAWGIGSRIWKISLLDVYLPIGA